MNEVVKVLENMNWNIGGDALSVLLQQYDPQVPAFSSHAMNSSPTVFWGIRAESMFCGRGIARCCPRRVSSRWSTTS